jgi:hypothetical protein
MIFALLILAILLILVFMVKEQPYLIRCRQYLITILELKND